MKRVFAIAAVAAAIWFWLGAAQADQASRLAMREAMRLKLDHARGVLEGLTLDRLALVITNAERLRDLNQTNAYTITGNPHFREAATNFLRHVDRLISSARAGNQQRATEAYNDVARGCIECHRTFRPEQFRKAQDAAARE